MSTRDDFDELAWRAEQLARPTARSHPPAVLPDIVERRYRRHVTDLAAALGVAERDLVAHLELPDTTDQRRQESA